MKTILRSTLLIGLSISAWAGTQITDTVNDALGNPVTGVVTFTPVGPWVSGGVFIAGRPVSARIAAGSLSVNLTGGQFYTITWQPSNVSPVQYAYVPVTQSVLRIADVTATPNLVPNFADAETPAGTINGTNAVFTLAHPPYPLASLILTRNGVVQRPGADFALSGSTVTFVTAATPQVGDSPDILQAWYRY